jgi:tRNA threonylcarbamoyladenosine biosynthesis protein TsaE
MIEIVCPTETDTLAAAGRLASICRPDDVIVLAGPLGAGKTAFVSGLADGLGVEEIVASPSYVLMRRYDSGFLPLVHVDVYRLSSIGEFEDLGVFEEGRGGVVAVEWGEVVGGVLPADRLTVRFTVESDGTRRLELVPGGIWQARPLEELVA